MPKTIEQVKKYLEEQKAKLQTAKEDQVDYFECQAAIFEINQTLEFIDSEETP